MKFSDLLYGVEVLSIVGDAEITGIQYDSRKVQRGDCFVAIKGESTDGNRYISNAIQSGAVAVVSDSADQVIPPGVVWAKVAHGRRALAGISENFYQRPAEKLAITGVTGTN